MVRLHRLTNGMILGACFIGFASINFMFDHVYSSLPSTFRGETASSCLALFLSGAAKPATHFSHFFP